MRSVLICIASGILLCSTALHAANIEMYGATWCSPCRKVQKFLKKHRIPHTYYDISKQQHRQKFYSICGGKRGIPLTVVGREHLRGSNLNTLTNTLQRYGYHVTRPSRTSSEQYGGHSPQWWQRQFRNLRQRLARTKRQLSAIDPKAVYARDRDETAAYLKEQIEILKASIRQLEYSASQASLPRRYRAYR